MSLISPPPLSTLSRPTGAFAMLAIDQRESMRAMFAGKQDRPVTDAQIADFKLAALRALTPFASAALIDKVFAWDRAVAEGAVAEGCSMIAAGDHFISGPGELISDVEIDENVVPAVMRRDGASAMKLLVIWRPDEPAEKRIALVDRFVARCREAGLLSVIEPVSRKRRDGAPADLDAGIIAAAEELGARGADLYKAEIPYRGVATETEVRRACERITSVVESPWVVLSSGVDPDHFPTAVEWACRGGASGFLAGRAVWQRVIGASDIAQALAEDAVPRLQKLVETVDDAVSR
ncbi:MAG TPA: aldolase [Kaistia sp.]|nr:aldolase [Kaistia sp.]